MADGPSHHGDDLSVPDPTSEDRAEKRGSFVQEVLTKCMSDILQDLQPVPVLDVFEEEQTFGENTTIRVRDLRDEKNTTDRNRKIRETIHSNPDLYVQFKRALVRTRQTGLLEIIEEKEKHVHAQQTGTLPGCACTDDASKCAFLESIKCPQGLPPHEASKVKDLRAILMDLYKGTFQRVPIYLLRPSWKHPVKDLYVNQELKLVDFRGKPEKSDDLNEQCRAKQNEKETKNKIITSIYDIFYKDGHKCKSVYVSGEAGMGKSTLCEHLVKLWCDANSTSDNTRLTHDEDLKAMSEFQLLFYINLGKATLSKKEESHVDEIAGLIYDQLQLSVKNFSLDDIIEYLCIARTLVLMDSLDESSSTKLPQRGLHNKSCIVTTSRPWKIEALRSQIEGNIDQQIEIVGLRENSSDDLAYNVVKILNKDLNKTKDSKRFIADMKSQGLDEFLDIPMMIIQMLSLWFDDESFGTSQFEIYCRIVHHQLITAIRAKELDVQENKEKTTQAFPIYCGDKSCPCSSYGDLLWKVTRLAYQTLFGENREMSLVFDHKTTSYNGLSENDINICLKIGFLTQHKMFVESISQEKKSVSFLHKTNQEFFAAIFLSGDQQDMDLAISYVNNDLLRALELDKVFMFCSQSNQRVTHQLSRLIYEIADRDPRVQEYRQSGEYYAPNRDLIYKIQNIVSATVQQSGTAEVSPTLEPQASSSASAHTGTIPDTRNSPTSSTPKRKGLIGKIKYFLVPSSKENRSRSKSTSTQESPSQQPAVASGPSTQDRSRSTPKLILADIILGEPQWRHTEKVLPVNVEALDMAAVKSVHIDAREADVTIWKHLEQARCLQTLVVEYGHKTKVETLHGVVLRNQATLRTLGLSGDDNYSRLHLSPLGNKLADMLTCDLTCLLLHRVKLSHKQCEILGRHLSTTQNLRQLTLSFMTFSHKQCEILCRHLSTTQNLRRLTLGYIECQTHGGWGSMVKTGCCDVKLHSKLEFLKLYLLPFNHVSFPADDLKTCEIVLEDNVPAATSAISCLTSASNLSNLREFTCWILRDVASVRELARVLPRLHGLQRIVLCGIDFGCLREIWLSVAAAKTLESVDLRFSTITADGLESLVQSVDAPRVKIKLLGVTITDGDPREFLQRLRDSPDVEVTEDEGVEYKDEDATRWGGVAGWEVEKFEFYKNK